MVTVMMMVKPLCQRGLLRPTILQRPFRGRIVGVFRTMIITESQWLKIVEVNHATPF